MKNNYTVYSKPSYSNPFTRSQSALCRWIGKGFLVLGMVLSSSLLLEAQTWERFFDLSSHDFSKSIHQTADGGVLMLANIGNGNSESDIFLLKLNADGDSLWSRTIDGGSYDEAEQLIFTADGNYLIAGYSFSFGNNGQFYLIKLDTEGNLLWERNYGGVDFDRGRTITETTDGNFVIAGWTRSPISGDVSQGPLGPVDGFDAWLIKVDANGNKLWDLRFGGIERDEIHSIAPAPNDGVVMVTNTTSPELGVVGADIYTLALDADGNTLWEEIYGGTEYEEVFSIIPTSDGGYAIGAITNSEGNGESDIYLIKTNDQGVFQWGQTYGGAEGEFGGFVAELTNGEYIISGATQSLGSPFLDVYLIRADAMGMPIWQQHYSGGDNVDISTDVQVTDDGYFIIAAQRREDDMTGILSSDLYILKTDAEGNTTTNSIVGTVLWDSDGDCTPDAGSLELEDWLIEAIGEKTYFGTTDANGNYQIEVDSGAYEVIIHPPHDYWAACFASNPIAFTELYDTLTADFVISDVIDCPYMTVDVSTPYLNRCGLNRYELRYCNTGPMMAGASFVNLTLHPDFILMDAELMLFSQNDNTYTFEVNSLNSLSCDGFWMDLMLDCNSNIQGQTHEIIAEISPDEICTPVDPGWDGSSIALEASCEGDSVTFTIRNKGMNDMSAESYYIVIIDDLLSRTNSYQLPGNGDLTFVEYPEGQTLRLETPQSLLHPGKSQPSVFVEACGTNSGGGISLGFVNQFPEDDGNAFVSIDAQESFETFLPNPLRAYPDGFGAINQIAPNTEIEYHVRFQHQGGDTLQKVIIEDQLPEELDVRTVRPGASSHPYDFEVLGEGIVRFTFENIQLPGDLIDESASHGFVKFKVQQQSNLSNGVAIGNDLQMRLGDTLINSNIVWHTIIAPTTYSVSSLDLCKGQAFLGQLIESDTTILDTLFVEGYDSIAIYNLTVLPIATSMIDTTLQEGGMYNGVVYEADTLVEESYQAFNGCDSIVTVNIVVETSALEEVTDLINWQCFPNPTDKDFAIRYVLPSSSRVDLNIYDLTGQKILSIYQNDLQTAGDHQFEVRDDELLPGTYLLRFQTEWGSFARKLVKL